MIVSPARPIACESEPIIEIAPRSCSTSSAAIVVARMRLSANARSSGTRGFRWWQTISMSRCSATVLTVCGRVGLVDDGSTFGNDAIRMMSGAWPPPAPSVWYAWIVRPAIASIVDSRKPGLVERVGVDRDLDARLVADAQAGVDRGRRRAPVLVQLEAAGAAAHLLVQRLGRDGVALAEQQHVDGALVHRAEHRGERVLARRAGRRLRALGRAGAAADQRRDPRGERLVDDLRADEVDVAVDPAGGQDPALAGEDLGARPDPERGVDAVGDVGVAGLAERDDPPVADRRRRT